MKSFFLSSLAFLFLTAGVSGQQSSCVVLDPLLVTVNPVPQGSSTALCSKIFNCGPHDRQFKVQFTTDTACGEHIVLADAKVAVGADRAVIVCCTDTLTSCVGDQAVSMTVSVGNLQLASTFATLTVN